MTLLETATAVAIAAGLCLVLLAVFRGCLQTAEHASDSGNQRAQIDAFFDELDVQAGSAWSIFVPAAGRLGERQFRRA